MKLLIITQKVDEDDPILGFFHRWIEEFSKHYERVIVICLERGQYRLPENVKVLSLGKEEKKSRFQYLLRFYKYIWKERKDYDSVFVHMNPEYLVLGGMLWRIWKKRIGLWYVHKQVNLKLWLAEKISEKIFSSTPESFRLKSKKVSFVGHGIEISKFNCEQKYFGDKIVLLHIGRITKIKNCDVAIRALALLHKNFKEKEFTLKFVGEPITNQDVIYLKNLQQLVEEEGVKSKVVFAGPVSVEKIVSEYCACDATLNLTSSGGMDKTVLESLSSKRPVFTSNTAFSAVLGDDENFVFKHGDHEDLYKKISDFIQKDGKIAGVNQVYENVRKNFSLTNLIDSIVVTLDGKAS